MRYTLLGLLTALPLVACTGSPTQTITGRIGPGFPTSITTVKVLQGGTVVASSRVAADGTFQLAVPPGSGLSIHLVGSGQSDVVFPRQSGTIAKTFAVRPGGVSFNLGTMYFVGSSTNFAFHDQSGSGSAGSGTCDASDDQDASGATCVDDGDTSGGTCSADGSDGAEMGDSGSGSDSSADAGSGSDTSSEGADPADGPDEGNAVAEHNFPADGCADGSDNGGDD